MTNTQKFSVVAVAPAYRSYAEEEKALAPLDVKVREVVANGDAAKLKQALEDVDLVFLRDTPLNGEIIKHMRRCKGIVRYGVGVDTVDLKAAAEQKIIVANVPDYGAEIEVSDHAAALTLALLRRIPSRHVKVTQKGVWRLDQEEPITRIGQRVLGLIGFGKIAQAYLARMRSFGVKNVVAYDPYAPDDVFAARDVKKVDIDTLCRTANLISIHAPATPETKHIVNSRTLALMAPQTAIINTSRGALVDEAALVETLRQHKIFGAALDVQEKEPMSADSPLQAVKDFENVILTNHMGWYSEESVAVLQRKAGEQGYQILTTGAPTNWVNRW
jgi:D-3-phosphoglycerate dehydrogenase